MLEWDMNGIIGDLPDVEIDWAISVLDDVRAGKWKDKCDIDTALMVKERACSEGRWFRVIRN